MSEPIIGCPRWNDRTAYYTQENNPTEHLLKTLRSKQSYLETCGPTASINCQASVKAPLSFETSGGYAPQPEQTLTDWFNDPNNFGRMKALWQGLNPEDLPGNEVAQWYPLAVHEVFGNQCDFKGRMSVQQVVDELRKGRSLQVCLVNPGHFVAVVAVDEVKQEFVIQDSWGNRWPGGDGFCQRMSFREYETNVKPLNLVYYPRGDYAA